MNRLIDRLRCWLRGRVHWVRYRERWHGHCWGHDGACMDCGWDG